MHRYIFASKVTFASVSAIVLLGIVLYFSDKQLFFRINWSREEALDTVVLYRLTVVVLQVLLLAISWVNARKAKISTRTLVVLGMAAILGFVLSAEGWLKIDSLLRDLTLA